MQFKSLLAVTAAIAPALAQEMMNLTALAGSDERLSTLGQVLSTFPDVASTLANATNITLFAPSNEAFTAFLNSSGLSLQDVTSDQVAALLNYHVVPGTYMAANITETPAFVNTLLENATYSNVTDGQVLECRLEDDSVIITSGLKTDATVVEPDLNFTGGVAHIIDAVNVFPLNISTTASAGNLTYFLGALEAANLTSVLDESTDITVFAPSNDAFEAIGSALGNLTTEQLTSILQYHVINGTIAYSSSIGNGSVETLGGNVNLTVADGSVFVGQARVVNADVLVSGGVLHVIDSVLNPNNTMAQADPEAEDAQVGFEGASSVASLPLTSGVPQATTTVQNLVTTTEQVAEGYVTVTEGAVGGGAGGASATSSDLAAVQTGAMGMAALFGGAALVANM